MNGADVAAAENAVNKNAQFGIFKRPVLDIRTAFVRTYIITHLFQIGHIAPDGLAFDDKSEIPLE